MIGGVSSVSSVVNGDAYLFFCQAVQAVHVNEVQLAEHVHVNRICHADHVELLEDARGSTARCKPNDSGQQGQLRRVCMS